LRGVTNCFFCLVSSKFYFYESYFKEAGFTLLIFLVF
jgi:hypothetical protein